MGEVIIASILIGALCVSLCLIYKGYQSGVGIVIALVSLMMFYFLALLGLSLTPRGGYGHAVVGGLGVVLTSILIYPCLRYVHAARKARLSNEQEDE